MFANTAFSVTGSAKPMSRLVTTNARCRRSRLLVTSGRASTRRWRRSMPNCKRICTTSRSLSATSKDRSGCGRETFGRCGISAFHPIYLFLLFPFFFVCKLQPCWTPLVLAEDSYNVLVPLLSRGFSFSSTPHLRELFPFGLVRCSISLPLL